MANKKVRGATPMTQNSITFKSKLEAMAYKVLVENGFTPEYEKYKYVIWEGFRPVVPFYVRNKQRRVVLNSTKLINITYTPDFYIEYKGYKVVIEMKGFVNDVYPIKLKLFRKYIEEQPDSNKYLLFEVYTKTQLLETIKIIKDYGNTRNN